MSAVAPGSDAQCFLSFASVAIVGPGSLPRPRRPGRRFRRHHLVEDLVLLDHAELEARALLDRFEPLLQVAHLDVERVVAALELRILLAVLREAAIELPHLQPAPLADPERILEGDEQRGENDGERLHRSW